MALNNNALTLLVTAKDHMDITDASQDTRVERLINVASEFIARYCRRTLVTTAHTEYVDGRGGNRITLKEWPILSGPALGATHPEVFIDNSSLFAASTVIDPLSYYVANQVSLIRVGGDNSSSGTTWNKGYRNIKVNYTAGLGIVNTGAVTNTFPADLEQACLDYVMWLFDMRNDRRVGRVNKSKAGESVTYINDIPPHITILLDPYVKFELPIEAPVGIGNR